MKAVVSLLGPSGSGKSTLAGNLATRFLDDGMSAAVIKKDEAIQKLSLERFNRAWVGYTPLRAMLPGRFDESELHAEMNGRLLRAQDAGYDIAILEGGTRTPKAKAETLAGLEDVPFGLIVMDIPLREIRQRLIQRRHNEAGRSDDAFPLMLCKLLGQYTKTFTTGAGMHDTPGAMVVDATQPPQELADVAYAQATEVLHLAT